MNEKSEQGCNPGKAFGENEGGSGNPVDSGRARAREIRVFVSSTFRDMARERDLLVKEVFPALRRKCAKRFVAFTEVDLRWGITEEQASEGRVLPLCLEEIERSRPYFIGLLGERYGWIPAGASPELMEREPWLREHVEGRTSVTELEILHGVLNDPKMEHLAFFYFRDPGYVNDPSLPEAERRELIERDIPEDVEKYGKSGASRRTEERREKLKKLKQRIRESKHPVVENYASPRALADIVKKQFDELTDRLYPEDEALDALGRERALHEAHAGQKLFACVDRPAHIDALNAFAESPGSGGRGLVVTGESGGGKTALLAAWARRWADKHPGDYLFQHYLGATPDSASADGLLRRLMGELKERFKIQDDIPADPEKLREALPLWLAKTSGGGRVLLVLDGLNQVTGADPDRRLGFLPRHLPPHVTALVSSLPGPALEELRGCGWKEHELPPTDEPEAEAMANEYLKIHAKTLEPELLGRLVSSPGAKNPLYLRTVLEELRQVGSFEELPRRAEYYLEADNPMELFLRVIRRLREDFEGEDKYRTELVRRALSLLWAARKGLSEPEWLDMLGDGESPLPRAFWTPLFLALEAHLSHHDGLFGFGHDFLRRAVEEEFLKSADQRKSAHLSLADYFENHPRQEGMSPRKAEELPYQLHAAEEWGRLEKCLTDIPMFLELYNDRTKWELTGYWHPLREKQKRDMGKCYTDVYRKWVAVSGNAGDHRIPNQIGCFLLENGVYGAAEPLLRRALETTERVLGKEHPNTLGSLNNIAVLLRNKGDFAAAKILSRRALEANERVLGKEHPDTLISINNLAGLLKDKGDYGEAEPLYRRALEVRERVLGKEHPDTLTSVNNLAGLLKDKGDYGEAEPLYRRALEARERVLGKEHPDTLISINDLAVLLDNKGVYAEAEPLYRRALEARECVMGKEHPETLASINNLAVLLFNKSDYAAAEPLYRRALEVQERVLGREHPDTLLSVNGLAVLLYNKGDYAAAEPLYRRVLEARERVLGKEHPETLTSTNNLALLLYNKGNYSAAEPLYRRTLEMQERVLGKEHPETLASVNNLAVLLDKKGIYAAAEPLYRRALEASEHVLGKEHSFTLNSINNLAVFLDNKGDYAAAEPLYRRALEGIVKLSATTKNRHPNLQLYLENHAGCLQAMGKNPQDIRSTLENIMKPFGMSPWDILGK